MAVNGQYSDGPFTGANYASTGAPGSASAAPESGGGATIGTVTVTTQGASSQIPQPQVSVQQGDTCAFASDSPVPPAGDPLSGLGLAQVTQTGAGEGSWHQPHPNSMNRGR